MEKTWPEGSDSIPIFKKQLLNATRQLQTKVLNHHNP